VSRTGVHTFFAKRTHPKPDLSTLNPQPHKNCTISASVLPHETSWPKLPALKTPSGAKTGPKQGNFFRAWPGQLTLDSQPQQNKQSVWKWSGNGLVFHTAGTCHWRRSADFPAGIGSEGHRSDSVNPVDSVYAPDTKTGPKLVRYRGAVQKASKCGFRQCGRPCTAVSKGGAQRYRTVQLFRPWPSRTLRLLCCIAGQLLTLALVKSSPKLVHF